jgi:hypothetical protein
MYSGPIRQIIIQAREQSGAREKLIGFLQKRRPFLHASITLPAELGVEPLADFIERYISHVPDFVEAIEQITEEAFIEKEVAPILEIARNYFVSPPDLITESSHLLSLLDKAYLAHRLLEEVNDRFMAQTGIPLTPMDNTKANLIGHELIGEPFANLLDQAVLFSAELLLSENKLDSPFIHNYVAQHKDRGWSDEIKRWPCLVDNLEIQLEFNEPLIMVRH